MEMKNLTPIRLPLRKICSDNADFDIEAARMETFFASRGYPDDVIRRGREQALTKSRVQILNSIIANNTAIFCHHFPSKKPGCCKNHFKELPYPS